MSSASKPSVVLYNPISGYGHLDSWNAMFAYSLNQEKYNVICITRNAKRLSATLEKYGVQVPVFEIDGSYKKQNTNHYSGSQQCAQEGHATKIKQKFYNFIVRYVNKEKDSFITPEMSVAIKIKKYIYQKLIPLLFSSLSKKKFLLPPRELTPTVTKNWLMPPDFFAKSINDVLKKISLQNYFVFHMYLDGLSENPNGWDKQEEQNEISFSWGGIKFAPCPPSAPYLHTPSFKGLCVLNENTPQELTTQHPGKHFTWLPDITETALPPKKSILSKEISQRAAGRTIVFMGGCITYKKNINLWTECIRRMNKDNFFFCQIGMVQAHTFSPFEKAKYDELIATHRENFFIHDEFIEDERTYNSIIKISNILWGLYSNFQQSANILSKAAHFKKPVIVSNKFLLGKRVEKYKIGNSVDENNAQHAISTLQHLAQINIPDVNFERYAQEHSQENLIKNLNDFFHCCLPQPNQAPRPNLLS